MNTYNKIHVLLINYSPTCFGNHCAIFRHKLFFLYAPNQHVTTRTDRQSNNTIEGTLANALYLADRTKLERDWEHILPHHLQKKIIVAASTNKNI